MVDRVPKTKKHQSVLIQTGHVLQAECRLIKALVLDYVLKEQYVLEQGNYINNQQCVPLHYEVQ